MNYRPTSNLKFNKNFNTFFTSDIEIHSTSAEEDYDFDMPDGPGTSSRLVLELIHPRVVSCLSSLPPILLMPSTLTIYFLRNFVTKKSLQVQFSHSCHQQRRKYAAQTSGIAV